jgi:hypothetical protein
MLKRTKAIETKRLASPKHPVFWANIPIVTVENEDEQRNVKQTNRKA